MKVGPRTDEALFRYGYATIDNLIQDFRGNQTKAAMAGNVNRGTFLKWYKNRDIYDVKFFMVDGEMRPYVFGRTNGRHKKGNK